MDQHFHLIEKYFQGKLSDQEHEVFNEKLQNDPAFEQEFRDMKLIKEGAKESARHKILDMLQSAETKISKQETTKISVSMKRLVSIAASLVVIATVSYFAISSGTGGSMSGDEIFASYYKPYPNIVEGNVRGNVSLEVTTLSARAYNAYDIADYTKSAELFAELVSLEKSAANYLYSGISNLATGNLEEAKNHLNVVMNSYDQFQEQAQWYLSMTLLKEGSEQEAIANLGRMALIKSSSSFVTNAKSVLSEMGLELALDDDGGVVEVVKLRPDPAGGESPAPDGMIDLEEVRRTQFGSIIDEDGKRYSFHNDVPMEDLRQGDHVGFIPIKGRNGQSIAIITVNYH